MKKIRYVLSAFAIIFGFFSCQKPITEQVKSYPSVFLVKNKTDGFTSVEELRKISKEGHQGMLFSDFVKQTESDLKIDYIDPFHDFEGRSPVHLKHGNVSVDMASGVSKRLSRLALMFLVTNEEKYKNLVMRQIEALYDTTLWPLWCDHAHVNQAPHVDIRTYRIAMWVALSYNWLHDYLSEEEKKFIIDGLDKRAIQPFWEKIAQKPGWYTHRHNWFTNMYGGMGITAMALGGAHPDSKRLLDTIVPAMIDFNKIIGKMGEFNEPPGYVNAIKYSVEFAEAYRYYTNNKRNLLNEKPFPEICYWIIYHTTPPGYLIPFGDTPKDKKAGDLPEMAAIANANNDSILQWYYLQYALKMKDPMELFWFNPKLKPLSPDGILPLGKAFKDYAASIISRTSWNPISIKSIVYSKSGREDNHDDNDVGQLCIEGFGERLIIDPGSPKPIYPADYFQKTQYKYYTRSSTGHNVLIIDNEEMISEPNHLARGKTIKSWFNDSIGSYWEMDLTPVYHNANKVTRKVAHLFPCIVVVLDEAELPVKNKIDLRWHCISQPQISNNGGFIVKNKNAALSAKVLSLNHMNLTFSNGHQEFKPPYNLTRQGDPLIQNYEPFVKISANSKSYSLLSIFAVSKNEDKISDWEKTETGWEIKNHDGHFWVNIQDNNITINSQSGKSISFE